MIEDVRFDPAASEHAASALRALADRLQAATAARAAAHARARDDWRGLARERVDDRLASQDRRADEIVADLRRAAAGVEARLQDAAAEQALRERQRALLDGQAAR